MNNLRILAASLRDEFNEAASQLDLHARNVNISRVTGGVAGVAGGVTAIVGAALLVPTLGASVVAVIVGSALAGAGGFTAGGASIFKIINERRKLKQFDARWSVFRDMLTRELEMVNRGASRGAAGVAGALATGLFRGSVRVAGASAEGATAAASVARAVAAGSIVLNVVLMGLSVYDIIDGAVQLHRETGSDAGDYLRKIANSLDEFSREGL